jgi:hypothetical protein
MTESLSDLIQSVWLSSFIFLLFCDFKDKSLFVQAQLLLIFPPHDTMFAGILQGSVLPKTFR